MYGYFHQLHNDQGSQFKGRNTQDWAKKKKQHGVEFPFHSSPFRSIPSSPYLVVSRVVKRQKGILKQQIKFLTNKTTFAWVN